MYDSEGVSTSPDIITWNLKWPPSAGGSVAIDNHDVLTILTPLAVAGGNILGRWDLLLMTQEMINFYHGNLPRRLPPPYADVES